MVQVVGVERRVFGKPRDRVSRKRTKLVSADRAAGGQLTEDDPQRMRAMQLLVAVACEQQGGDRLEPSGEEPQHVERGLVRPVDVFEHHHGRRRRLELAHQRNRHLVRLRAALDPDAELAGRLAGHVEQRPEGAGCEQRIARCPENPHRTPDPLAELAQQRGFSDPGLAPHEHELPA